MSSTHYLEGMYPSGLQNIQFLETTIRAQCYQPGAAAPVKIVGTMDSFDAIFVTAWMYGRVTLEYALAATQTSEAAFDFIMRVQDACFTLL